MRIRTTLSALALTALVAACGPGQVVVTAEVEVQDPETGETITQPLTDKEIQLLPFDRDAIFDSLTQVAPTPEPPIPDSVTELQTQVRAANDAWREAEVRWQTLRDTLQQLNDYLGTLDPTSAEYTRRFQDWQNLNSQYEGVERAKDQAFEEYTELQEQTAELFNELRLEREAWADQAFEDYSTIVAARLRDMRATIHFDTTDTSGTATFEVTPGEWWVYTRHALPYQELYWNIPIVVQRGDPLEIVLNEDNAERRQTLR